MIVQDAYEVYLAYNLYLKPKTNDKKKKIPNDQDCQGIQSYIRPVITHVSPTILVR